MVERKSFLTNLSGELALSAVATVAGINISPFHVTGISLYPLKTSKKLCFFCFQGA